MKLAILSLFIFSSANASQALKVEYRLEAKAGGQPYKWSSQVAGGSNAKARMLEDNVFLSNDDFSTFQVKKLKSPPNNPDSYEVELVHTQQGRTKYDLIANQARDRVYCVVIGEEIYQCMSFTPKVKELWDKSTSIGAFSKDQAKKLAASLEGKP